MKKVDTVKLIGMVGLCLGGIATMISNWSQQQAMEQTVEEKVEKAIAEWKEAEES